MTTHAQELDRYRSQTRGSLEMYGRADTTELAVQDFLGAVLDHREPLQGAADGLAEVKALLLGYQSAREGRAIAIA